jgi:hypothetical protein
MTRSASLLLQGNKELFAGPGDARAARQYSGRDKATDPVDNIFDFRVQPEQ